MDSSLSDDENKIVNRRLETLLGIWDKVSRSPYFVESGDTIFHLNEKLLGEVVAQYIYDLKALKLCYGINDKVQFPKIAGLMTNAIVKHKPLVPRIGNNDLKPNSLIANEVFALFYGLCVLFDTKILPEGNFEVKVGDSIRNFIQTPLGIRWRNDIHYLLHSRNYTSDSLIAIFETLCISLAPELLEYDSDG
jgi:hypothetical protein